MKSKLLSKSVSLMLIFIMVCALVYVRVPKVEAASSYTQTLKSGLDAFPESYRVLLENFIRETDHTNWNFQAYYTGIDWNEFMDAEAAHGMNRVHLSFDTRHRCECDNLASGYYCADRDITAYFADPRNFINERNIFQFLEISYNKDLYTIDIVREMIKNYKVFNYGQPITFTLTYDGHLDYGKEVTMTFADIIMDAALLSQMSPISIVTKIIQEVGQDGSASVTGDNSTYPGCYNYFNIGAYDTGDAILNGLNYADKAGWHCPYSSIVGGAKYNTKYYILEGQNTPYFYKYDCVGNKILQVGETVSVNRNQLYHQYMTNISDPYSQSARYYSTYTNYNLLNQPLNFIIPVFDNMPAYVGKPSTLSVEKDKDLYYTNISSTLYTRTGPGYNYGYGSVVLYRHDLVIMLERHVNGGEWDKVQFWNGDTGYALSEYMEKYEDKLGLAPIVPTAKPTVTPFPSPTPLPPVETIPTPVPTEPPVAIERPSADQMQVVSLEDKIIGYGYADVSSTLNVRSGAGTSNGIVGRLASKDEFKILDETDGWYKIKTDGNVEGFISKDYAKMINYAREDNGIITILPITTAEMVAQYLNSEEYGITDSNGFAVKGNKLATGYNFFIKDNVYKVVKIGDVNGDSRTNTLDALMIMKHMAEIEKITDENLLLAGRVNADDKMNSLDALQIQKYSAKLISIYLNEK